ncbi:MAG TPA: hypothetical protein VE571_14995 [Solirubrobacteraceae bacterium]|jgi:hypothetical protein|nr:hypothetical protein [Solirubrobacteraceae bacterium]
MPPTHIARSPWRRGAPALAAAGLMLAAAGCGGGAPSSTSTNASAAHAQGPGGAAYRFADCMRSHGVHNFPDPVVHVSSNNGATRASVGIRITPGLKGSPAFKAATTACNHILPGPDKKGLSPAQQQARTRAMVAFAQCLRTHGFPHFPDPNAQGDLSLQTVSAAGINIHTPALLTAGKACTSVTHGQITPAQVVRAINGPH